MKVRLMQEHNPITYARSDWPRLSARLMLAHLEDDTDMQMFYREVWHETGLDEAAFIFADETAATFAEGYRSPAAREQVRSRITRFLDECLAE
jgi:hypothetical protein